MLNEDGSNDIINCIMTNRVVRTYGGVSGLLTRYIDNPLNPGNFDRFITSNMRIASDIVLELIRSNM